MRQIGSGGERHLQHRYGTVERAARFYAEQVLDHLTPAMIDFVGRQEIAFVATTDAAGECDNSLRAGAPGFLHVIDPQPSPTPSTEAAG